MSIPKHHPDPAMLVEFSAGTLGTAQSICVAAHLHFCEHCRNEVLRLDQIGSQLLSQSEPETVDSNLFDSVFNPDFSNSSNLITKSSCIFFIED